MNREATTEDLDRWRLLIEADKAATAARTALFADRTCLVDLVRLGLRQPGERAVALDVASRLRTDEIQVLFPDLLALASFGHGLTDQCRELILRLPRAWLLSQVERHAEPLLADGGDEEYRALLGLYARIDPALALNLARRAAQHADSAVKEAGEDYLFAAENRSVQEIIANAAP
jgi:hypothetical protein